VFAQLGVTDRTGGTLGAGTSLAMRSTGTNIQVDIVAPIDNRSVAY
jgi:hypothetical protein